MADDLKIGPWTPAIDLPIFKLPVLILYATRLSEMTPAIDPKQGKDMNFVLIQIGFDGFSIRMNWYGLILIWEYGYMDMWIYGYRRSNHMSCRFDGLLALPWLTSGLGSDDFHSLYSKTVLTCQILLSWPLPEGILDWSGSTFLPRWLQLGRRDLQ